MLSVTACSLCITNLFNKPASTIQEAKKKKSCLFTRPTWTAGLTILSFEWKQEREIQISHISTVSTSFLGYVLLGHRKSFNILNKNNIQTSSNSVLPWSQCLCMTFDLNILETSFAGCSSELCNSMSSFSLGSVTYHPFSFVWIIPHRLVLLGSQKGLSLSLYRKTALQAVEQ